MMIEMNENEKKNFLRALVDFFKFWAPLCESYRQDTGRDEKQNQTNNVHCKNNYIHQPEVPEKRRSDQTLIV